MKQEESSEPAAASKEYACTALEQVSQTSVSLPSSFASMRAHRHDSRNLLGSGVCDMTDFCEVSSVHKLGKKKSLQAGPVGSWCQHMLLVVPVFHTRRNYSWNRGERDMARWRDRETERGWCSHCVSHTEHTRAERSWLPGWRSIYVCGACRQRTVACIHNCGAAAKASPLPRALDGGMWGEHDRSSSVQ